MAIAFKSDVGLNVVEKRVGTKRPESFRFLILVAKKEDYGFQSTMKLTAVARYVPQWTKLGEELLSLSEIDWADIINHRKFRY